MNVKFGGLQTSPKLRLLPCSVVVAMRRLLRDNHETPAMQARLARRAIALGRSLLDTGVLVQDLVTSTLRLLLGMGIAAALGIPAGVLIGLHRPTRWASALPVQFVRMISPLSWAPVAVALAWRGLPGPGAVVPQARAPVQPP